MIKTTFFLNFLTLICFSGLCQNPTSDKAKICFDKKDYKEAIKLYTKVITSNEANHYDYYYRGQAYLSIKKGQEAFEDFSASIEKSKDFAEAYFMRGVILINPQQVNYAINDLSMAIKYAKNDSLKALSYSNRAGAKLYTQNYESALKDCLESLKIDSVGELSRAAYVNMSTCYGYLGNREKSIEILTKIYKMDSTDISVMGNLGYELSNIGRHEESIYYFNRALKLQPNEAFILSNKSFSCLKLGKLDEALTLINKSIKYNPENSYAYKNLGLIYIEMKNQSKACEAFHTAVKKGFSEIYGEEVTKLIKTHCM